MLAILLSIQAVPTTVERVMLPDPSLDHFDLAKVKPKARDCGETDPGGDIIICARKKSLDIDISNMPDFAEKPIRFARDLSPNARAAVTAEQVDVGGFPSKRIMAGIKWGF